LRSPLPKPGLYTVSGGVLSLSGPALKEFLQAVLAHGAAFRFRARGFSMHPFIRDGDIIMVSPYHGEVLHPGEVVACCHPMTGRLVVHRLVKTMVSGFLLRGDNCPAADGFLCAAGILGRVTRVERNGRLLRLGLGLEGRLLAFLSRHHLLQPLLQRMPSWLLPFLRKRPL
jgi:hypothetical protein